MISFALSTGYIFQKVGNETSALTPRDYLHSQRMQVFGEEKAGAVLQVL